MSTNRSSLGVAIAVSVVVFAAVLGTIVVVRRPAEPVAPTYSDETRAAFLASCTAGGAETAPTCACAYDKIVQSVPYDRYLELNRQLAQVPGTGSAGSAAPTKVTPTLLPNDLEVLVVSCIARQSISTATTAVVQRAGSTPIEPTTSAAPAPSLTIAPS